MIVQAVVSPTAPRSGVELRQRDGSHRRPRRAQLPQSICGEAVAPLTIKSITSINIFLSASLHQPSGRQNRIRQPASLAETSLIRWAA
jgi:hypothetical protein